MDAGEVVEREVQRERVNVVLQLLQEAVGEPGKPTHGHAHRKVLALNMGRADMGNVGITFYPMLASANAFCGAVASRRFCKSPEKSS